MRGFRAITRPLSFRPAIGSIIVLLGIIVALWVVWLPLPAELHTPLTGTPILLDIQGREIAELPLPEARVAIPLKLDEMGRWLPRVIVALEDKRFYRHSGIDWLATAGAGLRDLRSAKILAGGSTITQQLVKLAGKRQQRNWCAKIYEAIVAWKLEHLWTKQRILAEYLNRSSFGNRRIGPEAAARAYFGKPARDLNLAESAYIAGLSQAPTRFDPWRHPDRAQRKYLRSLDLLSRSGLISDSERKLLAESPPVPGHFLPPRLAPNFVEAIRRSRPYLAGKIRTTLDLDLQQIAEARLRAHILTLNRYDVSDAAVVILDNATGGVRAMVGSADFAANQINGAMRPRSCGSTLKPFVYLTAIDRRLMTAATLLPDTPDAIRDEYRDYDPRNFNHRYLGPVRVREALACSLNVPAIVVLGKIGARSAFYELQKWGLEFPRSFDSYGAGFVLGNAEIRLLDLAAAYAGLARGGLSMRAKLLASESCPVARVASEPATEIITDILCDNDARKKSFGLDSPLAFQERVAAKTGTSSGFRDAWAAGFNREHTVAVWAGNSSGSSMHDTLAVRAAAPLWSAIMRDLLRTDHSVPLPDVPRREICALTGLLPCRFSREKKSELFLSGTEPALDSATWFTEEGRLLLPAEYVAWCASPDNLPGARTVREIRITNPRPGAVYRIDPVLPPDQQMLELRSTQGSGVAWFIGGQRVEPQPDGRCFWQLLPGHWNLKALTTNGSLEEKFTVE